MNQKMLFLIMLLLTSGCTESQKRDQGMVFIPAASLFFASRYDANSIQKVLCRDKEGNLLYLFPDRNTQIEITSKSTNELVKMYFDTVFFEGSKLVGLRSRMVPGMNREMALTDIAKIEIYAEFPRTEKVKPK